VNNQRVAGSPIRKRSSCLSHATIWFQLAPVWSTILRSPTATFGSVNQASLRQALADSVHDDVLHRKFLQAKPIRELFT